MRDWELAAGQPLSMHFASDIRLGHTDYADDQSWEILFGGTDEPALIIQTRYGGRAGLARFVPMWVLNGRPIYETQALAALPVLRQFAPNYAKITAKLLPTLALTVELWVMDSHAVGGKFTLENASDTPVAGLQFDLFAQVMREGTSVDMNLLGLDSGGSALHLGKIGDLNPVLMMEYTDTAAPQRKDEHVSPKLSAILTVPAHSWATVRWCHAGRPDLNASLKAAFQWLYQNNWDDAFKRIVEANERLPQFETGNAEWDAAIAWSSQVLLRSYIGPTGNLPYPSFVNARIPSRGFSPRGNGSDYGWQWSGPTPTLAYLVLPATSYLAPDLALGAFRNMLTVSEMDGWVDFKAGLGGQRANLLAAPLLATIGWRLAEITEDDAFVKEALPMLLRFFERWFQPDMDKDDDGLPEWTNAIQSGYSENPLFARFRRWAQNADINKVEAPDLAALLIGEGRALLKMADQVGDPAAAGAIRARLEVLQAQIEGLWNEEAGAYLYRDRDTQQTMTGAQLFRGKGDEAYDKQQKLDIPNRLILRVVGGRDHAPRVSAAIEGINERGSHVSEIVSTAAFSWYYGMGTAVSENVYTQVNYVRFEGLSRVYNVEIDTVDLFRHFQPLLLPLWAAIPGKTRANRMRQLITDEARYWRPFGMPICPTNDPAFAANNDSANGSGGVWLAWNTLLIEGLLQYGYVAEASALFARILEAQVRALKQDRGFREAYNSETGEGLGDIDEIAGIVPLHLVMTLIGLRIVNARRVWAGGVFALPNPVTVRQHGVEVTRSASSTKVRFASGHSVEVGADWQLIDDPTPVPTPEPEANVAPAVVSSAPGPTPASSEAPQEPPSVTTALAAPATDAAHEAAQPGSMGSVIPVHAKKDETMEVQISHIDFGAAANRPPAEPGTPGPVKIPVSGPDDEK